MKKVVKFGLPGFIALLILLWFGLRSYMSFSIADYYGDITIAGIEQPVEVTFDEKGIPQIWAETDRDMYFTLGWLHASERLFQMELVRRVVYGELAELLGDSLYAIDLKQRRIGFARRAQRDLPNLKPEHRTLLEAYCAGINAWAGYKSVLPPEFLLLDIQPREWKVVDCLGIALYQTWYAHSLIDKDLEYGELMATLGDSVTGLKLQHKDWSPPTVHDSFLKTIFGHDPYPFRMNHASNSWVIAPEKSASGAALHASDPHLRIERIPGFWYIAGLHSAEGTDVLGVTAPGLPQVLMGHNRSIAYAFTVASIDVIDYYREQCHPEDSMQVLTAGGYRPLRQIRDTIRVRGKAPRAITVCESERGVVVGRDSASVLTLKWAGFDFSISDIMSGAFRFHRLDNFADFRETVTRFGALDVNWTYSDIRGNIGYQLGAPIPRRSYADTYRARAGEDSTTRWQGYYPLEETPYLYNPQEGWLASCNNQIVSANWPYPLPGFYDPYRITRANAHLTSQTRFSREDMEKMQLDLVSGKALRWKHLLSLGAAELGRGDLAEKIETWDGAMAPESEIAGTFALWWEFLPKFLFEDELGRQWHRGSLIREEVLSRNWAEVVDDRRSADQVETLAQISAATLEYVLDRYSGKSYGDICRLRVVHPLSRAPWIGKLLDFWLGLNRGPYPALGDDGSLNASFNFWDKKRGELASVAGPSMRFVLDWADLDSFTIQGNFGQSGNPLSPHYDDFFELMRNGERWVVPFTREKVYQRRVGLLKLRAKG